MTTNNLSLTNDWGLSELTTNCITVDNLAKKYKLEDLDFIKIDTDGADRDVLESAKDTIHNSPVLGIWIEINFIGDENSPNSFHSIDRTLRSWGFELFDISSRKYSVASLPTAFEFDCFAQNIYGKVQQGDALYLRDPMSKQSYHTPLCPELSVDKLLKLVCIYEIFNLPDHAAELLVGYRDELSTIIDVDENLNILTQEVTGRDITYSEYIRTATPESLLPHGTYGKYYSIEEQYMKVLEQGNSISTWLLKDKKIIKEDFYNWRLNFDNASLNEFRLLAHAAFNLDTLEQQYEFIKKYTKQVVKSALVTDSIVFSNYFLNIWECVNSVSYLESYPWNIAIPIADLCNAKCTFCDSWLRGTGIVTVEDLDFFIEPIKHARILVLQGHGEPLVNPNIDSMLLKLSEMVPEECRTSIITNGFKLEEKLDLLLKANVQVFNISLNATTAEVHDIVMGLGPAAFDKVIGSVKTLANLKKQDKNIEITLSIVVTQDNVHQVVDFIDLAHSLNVDHIYLRTLGHQGEWSEKQISAVENPRDLMLPGLNYYQLPPYLHSDFENIYVKILDRIKNSTITIECQPETWKTPVYGENWQKFVNEKWDTIKFIPREEAAKDKSIREYFKESQKLIKGQGNHSHEIILADYNPYNRQPKFNCKFAYHRLLSFETNLQMQPCCYMSSVPGYEPVVIEDSNFKRYQNSPAMIKLRDSLNNGPLFDNCKTCPWQG
jgi:molybdenum cofactor biosynthesis enzyme MoaA